MLSAYFFLVTYWLPALLSVLYFVFGNNIFIFKWDDSVLVFLIEYVISFMTPLLFTLGFIYPVIYWVNIPEWRGMTSSYMVMYIVHAYFLEKETMRLSVGAIRYL